jgi:hypothetical protein
VCAKQRLAREKNLVVHCAFAIANSRGGHQMRLWRNAAGSTEMGRETDPKKVLQQVLTRRNR